MLRRAPFAEAQVPGRSLQICSKLDHHRNSARVMGVVLVAHHRLVRKLEAAIGFP